MLLFPFLLLLALVALANGSGGSACLPTPQDGSQLCITWSVASSNITLNVLCVSPTSPPPAVGSVKWCAVGFAISPNAKYMFPANIVISSPLAGGGCTASDLISAKYSQPACLDAQFSSVLACGPSSGGVNAMNFTITRPLTVPAPAVSLVAGTAYNVIGALSTSSQLPTGPVCPANAAFDIHESVFSGGPALTFF